jgi:CheY-like chemotaxis protein
VWLSALSSLVIESEAGLSADFFSTRPTAKSDSDAVSGRATMRARSRARAAKLIVIIDDDRLTLEAMEGLLRGWGYGVVAALSDDEALDRLGGRRPDFIISDYQLADGKLGTQAIERLRRAFEIPAVIITGSDKVTRAEQARFDLLYKPLQPTMLKAALDRVFSSQRLTPEPKHPE